MLADEFNDSAQDRRTAIIKQSLQSLLPPGYKLELNSKIRILSLLRADSPTILRQVQFTKNEWSIFLTLVMAYPHFASNETLLASITSLTPIESHQRLQEAKLMGTKALKRELKPVYRALSGIRAKLTYLCPELQISPIRGLGYTLVSKNE
jgi:hypothetical protein